MSRGSWELHSISMLAPVLWERPQTDEHREPQLVGQREIRRSPPGRMHERGGAWGLPGMLTQRLHGAQEL